MKYVLLVLAGIVAVSGCGSQETSSLSGAGGSQYHVRVSPRDPHYFELEDGAPYIPIGCNMIYPADFSTEGGLAQLDEWFQALEDNGGNFARVWLSNEYWNIEHEAAGVYDDDQVAKIDRLFELAKKHNIRLKLTLEHFRTLEGTGWASKSIYNVANGGFATDVTDFFTGEAGRAHFLSKLDWYQNRYGDDPVVFAWELWNEINAVSGRGWMEWTRIILPELHKRFPNTMAIQSLGSFDSDNARISYQEYVHIPSNDIAQVHRYLDPGARLDVCHGPMDILAADAVTEILSCHPGKPVLLAESGAVEANHSGPSKLYPLDDDGLLLHDVLFAPFFAGAAGTGQIWHWETYVAPHNLWWQFGRFAEAVRGLDPPAEGFVPMRIAHRSLRIYGLKGAHTFIAWCRDAADTWEYELRHGNAPATVSGAQVNLAQAGVDIGDAQVQVYDPWANVWNEAQSEGNVVTLPDFTRSVVLKVTY